MISIQEKMIVAENCEEYKPKEHVLNASMSAISQGCDICINYINDKCTRELLKKINEEIRIN